MTQVRKVIQLRILSPLVGLNYELLDARVIACLFLQRKMVKRAVSRVKKVIRLRILSLVGANSKSLVVVILDEIVIACFCRWQKGQRGK